MTVTHRLAPSASRSRGAGRRDAERLARIRRLRAARARTRAARERRPGAGDEGVSRATNRMTMSRSTSRRRSTTSTPARISATPIRRWWPTRSRVRAGCSATTCSFSPAPTSTVRRWSARRRRPAMTTQVFADEVAGGVPADVRRSEHLERRFHPDDRAAPPPRRAGDLAARCGATATSTRASTKAGTAPSTRSSSRKRSSSTADVRPAAARSSG